MLSLVPLFLNIGSSEMVLIMFVALLLFGGDKLPGLARGLGKGIRDFKDASEGVKREINNQINSYEDKKEANAITPHTEVTEPAATEGETKPLIDTSPVAGTAAIGEHPVTETHPAEGHVTEAHGLENHTADTHVHTTAEPVKTTHE